MDGFRFAQPILRATGFSDDPTPLSGASGFRKWKGPDLASRNQGLCVA